MVAPAAPRPGGPRLVAEGVTLGYPAAGAISEDLSAGIPAGSFCVIVGPNACGKSTLLRALARLLSPSAGRVVLDGKDLASYRPRELARQIGLLAQSPTTPDGITVADLVSRGRFPHQGLLRQWSGRDDEIVRSAMARTGVDDLAGRLVAELSGGQRQRVWVAMALAQEPSILLLDEPTTFLDVAHQIEVLELCRELNEQEGTTIVAVLHDLNQACRYADQLIAMKDGGVVGHGPPRSVITVPLVAEVFGVRCTVIADPVTGTPLVVPLGGRAALVSGAGGTS